MHDEETLDEEMRDEETLHQGARRRFDRLLVAQYFAAVRHIRFTSCSQRELPSSVPYKQWLLSGWDIFEVLF